MSKALPVAVAIILGGAALIPVYYATQHPATNVGSKADQNASPVQKISYALGYEVANQTPAELDVNAFVQGIRDGHAHTPTRKSSFKPPILLISKKRSKKSLSMPKSLNRVAMTS